MTEPTPDTTDPEGTETPDPNAETDPADTEATGEGQPSGDKQERRDAKVRAERDQLRTDVDTMRSQLTAMRWAEVRRRSADRLADPTDLALVVSDEDINGLFTEGEIDTDALGELLATVTEAHPNWRKRQPSWDTAPKQTAPLGRSGASWSQVLKGR